MTPPADTPVTLRVVDGRLAGAEKAWAPGARLSIGHQFWQDVVLRDPRVRGIAVEVTRDAEGQAHVAVLSGEVSLLGSTVAAGGNAILPPYVPLSLGGVSIAWGDPESSRWTEAGALAGAVPLPPAPPPTAQDQARAMAERGFGRVRGLVTGPRLAAGIGAVLLLVAVSSAEPAMEAMGLRPNETERVARALDAAGLRGLQATADNVSGGVFVTGTVPDQAARLKAQQVLAATHVPGTVDVHTSQDLANAAADVARLRGLEARARPIGRSAVELHTTPLSPEERAKLIEAVRADVNRIGRLAVIDDLVPSDEAPVRTVSDVTKKVSTVVAGDPAYIRTADGARYFPGAMMPTGHRLVAIKEQVVVLEKNGRETLVNF